MSYHRMPRVSKIQNRDSEKQLRINPHSSRFTSVPGEMSDSRTNSLISFFYKSKVLLDSQQYNVRPYDNGGFDLLMSGVTLHFRPIKYSSIKDWVITKLNVMYNDIQSFSAVEEVIEAWQNHIQNSDEDSGDLSLMDWQAIVDKLSGLYYMLSPPGLDVNHESPKESIMERPSDGLDDEVENCVSNEAQVVTDETPIDEESNAVIESEDGQPNNNNKNNSNSEINDFGNEDDEYDFLELVVPTPTKATISETDNDSKFFDDWDFISENDFE
ncbi:hypothetical protein V1514DRAFT_15159 [Lipomyces japonicus]|uniref:uncharacterized protein n=1 Tax=Lipomyces japonicus TaxID=56871 RepID=UPI0034CEAA4B